MSYIYNPWQKKKNTAGPIPLMIWNDIKHQNGR